MKRYNITKIFLLTVLTFFLAACSEDEGDNTLIKNACLKWTQGPNLAGQEIEFSYAMAVPYNSGQIVSAWVEASIPGANGTWMDPHSYYTDPDGQNDVGILVGNPSVTEGKTTTVDFVVDTCAATLRYHYVIPEEAKGKKVSFKFMAKASNGETISYDMGPYNISMLDMKLDLTLTRANRYISIEDMEVYDAATAATIPNKIDLIYHWQEMSTSGVEFGHSFMSATSDPVYFTNLTLPEGLYRKSKIRKGGIKDVHLARLHLKPVPEAQPQVYVDDIDFQEIDLSNMPDYALGLIADDGMWVETDDGKYRAYIYINSTRDITGAVISMKRYQMY